MKNPRIFVSPINSQIIAAVERFDPECEKVGFIISSRQHNYSGGYIDLDLIRSLNKNRVLERDHFCSDDPEDIKYDANFFSVIHLDPWFDSNFSVERTKDWMLKFLEHNPNLTFEIGTEDFIADVPIESFLHIYESIDNTNLLGKVDYIVAQGGSLVFDLKNTSAINRLKTMPYTLVAQVSRIKSKRHNCDFHTEEELGQLASYGIDSFNFCPELTSITNGVIIEEWEDLEVSTYYPWLCKNAPWRRWVADTTDVDKLLVSCLHYHPELHFTTEQSNKAVDKLCLWLERTYTAINNPLSLQVRPDF